MLFAYFKCHYSDHLIYHCHLIEQDILKNLEFTVYLQVFKHTFDVVRDYACYLLLAIGAIAISVRFLTFGNGEIACMVLSKILLN